MLKHRIFKWFLGAFLLLLVSFTSTYAQVEMLESTSAHYYYSGTIGSREHIEFNLQVDEQEVSGSYIITHSGDQFTFSGRMDLDRKGIGIRVYNKANTYVASIEAKIISKGSNFAQKLEGKWRSASGKTIRSVHLVKVAEFAVNEPNITYSVSCSR